MCEFLINKPKDAVKTVIYDENTRPDTQELIDVLFNDENDPRSNNYQRILYRPKVKWRTIAFLFALWIAAITVTVIVLRVINCDMKWTVAAAIFVAVIYIIIFAKKIVITGVRIYQRYAPDTVRNKCRFEPSCSEYMIMAIQKYGLLKGTRKGIARLKRCNPSSGGYDLP